MLLAESSLTPLDGDGEFCSPACGDDNSPPMFQRFPGIYRKRGPSTLFDASSVSPWASLWSLLGTEQEAGVRIFQNEDDCPCLCSFFRLTLSQFVCPPGVSGCIRGEHGVGADGRRSRDNDRGTRRQTNPAFTRVGEVCVQDRPE